MGSLSRSFSDVGIEEDLLLYAPDLRLTAVGFERVSVGDSAPVKQNPLYSQIVRERIVRLFVTVDTRSQLAQ